jgi:hypothetical protein
MPYLYPMMFCYVCGFESDTATLLCDTCALVHGVSVDFVPATCGDDVCYLTNDGINLDGECSHSADFYAVFDPKFMFI